MNNQLLRGAYSGAVTFGHTTLLEHGPECSCGNKGCWEALASLSAFLKELDQRGAPYRNLDLDRVKEFYLQGDPVVKDVAVNYTGYWMGVGIANMLNVFNPHEVIIQGDMTFFGDEVLAKIREIARSRALPVSGQVKIVYSDIKEKASVKGAASIVISRFFSKEHHRLYWR